MPVLPLVASTIVVRPGSIRPSASAASIIATPMRSLTEPPGLNISSLANSAPGASGGSRVSCTIGVRPTQSAMLIGIGAIPAHRLMAASSAGVVRDLRLAACARGRRRRRRGGRCSVTPSASRMRRRLRGHWRWPSVVAWWCFPLGIGRSREASDPGQTDVRCGHGAGPPGGHQPRGARGRRPRRRARALRAPVRLRAARPRARDGVPRHGRPVPRAGGGPAPAPGRRPPLRARGRRPRGGARRAGGGGDRAARGSGLRFADPWGNEVEIVEYGDVQFTKAAGGAARDGARRADARPRRRGRSWPRRACG